MRIEINCKFFSENAKSKQKMKYSKTDDVKSNMVSWLTYIFTIIINLNSSQVYKVTREINWNVNRTNYTGNPFGITLFEVMLSHLKY